MIRTIPPAQEENRAVSVAVTHILAIGITTILIVGLLTAAGGMAEEEQDRSARQQLQMIGSSMANQIEQADELGQRGANVTVREQFEGTVSGHAYTVDFETDCDEPTINTTTCLVLNLTNSDISATVGVSNRSSVTFDHLGSGTVQIISEPGGTSGDMPYDPTILEQVGVGGEIYELPPGTGALAELNKPPIAKFTVTPTSPQYGQPIILNASESFDPEGNISEYIWNFTGKGDPNPGRFNQTTDSPTIAIPTGPDDKYSAVTPLDPGRYTVELTVVDPAGNKGSASGLVKVAGLVYGGNATAIDYDGGSPGGLFFNLVNKHSSQVTVSELYIDPTDEDIYEIDNSAGLYGIQILNSDKDAVLSSPIGIYEGGRVIKQDEWNQHAQIAAGDQPDVHFVEFKKSGALNMTGKSGDLAFRYYIDYGSDKDYYSTRYTFTADSPYVSGLSPSTFEQCWREGSSGKDIKAEFDNVDQDDSASFEVLHASGNLSSYNWDGRISIDSKYPDKHGKVYVDADLSGVDIDEPEYLIIELTVNNEHGTKSKLFYIEVVPSGMTCN